MASLEARYRGGTLGEKVDDFTLAFIAPLGANDDDEFTHGMRLLSDQEKNHHPDEHAAQAGEAQLAITDLEKLRERALHTTRIQKGGDALEYKKQAQRREQIRQAQRHGSGSRPARTAGSII
jgi:hypothetical protein